MKAAEYALGAMLLLAGCATQSPRSLEYHAPRTSSYAELAAALDKAEAQWTAADVRKYSLDIRRGGVFGGSVFAATYRGTSCRARHLKDIGLSSSFECEQNSMPQLFAEIRKEIEIGESEVALSLDPEIGYIHWFFIEPKTDFPDQGWGVEIKNLKVLR